MSSAKQCHSCFTVPSASSQPGAREMCVSLRWGASSFLLHLESYRLGVGQWFCIHVLIGRKKENKENKQKPSNDQTVLKQTTCIWRRKHKRSSVSWFKDRLPGSTRTHLLLCARPVTILLLYLTYIHFSHKVKVLPLASQWECLQCVRIKITPSNSAK